MHICTNINLTTGLANTVAAPTLLLLGPVCDEVSHKHRPDQIRLLPTLKEAANVTQPLVVHQ